MRKKLLYVSSMAVPHQVQLCNALQDYYDARFWFYEGPERTRGAWWRVDLAPHCRILSDVLFARDGWFADRYVARGLNRQMREFNPDIVMLGGFSIPGNIWAYRWAKRNGKRTVVFTERSRTPQGELRRRDAVWRALHWIYRDVDLVLTCAEDVVPQFRDEFRFGDKVAASRYATDLDSYFDHPLRRAKPGYTYLFANRMTAIYGPETALRIFAQILARSPQSRLLMNAAGEMGEACRRLTLSLGIEHAVEFLTDIKRWDELHQVYARSDILLLPATFSNGNATILEAMASGMGIVVSDRVLGSGRMIVDGQNGFNCEPTEDAFCERIERYIADPSLFATHASINRDAVRPLTASGTAKAWADTLEQRL